VFSVFEDSNNHEEFFHPTPQKGFQCQVSLWAKGSTCCVWSKEIAVLGAAKHDQRKDLPWIKDDHGSTGETEISQATLHLEPQGKEVMSSQKSKD